MSEPTHDCEWRGLARDLTTVLEKRNKELAQQRAVTEELRAVVEAAQALAECEHTMTCRVVGNGCTCGAWAQRNERRAEFYRRLRKLTPPAAAPTPLRPKASGPTFMTLEEFEATPPAAPTASASETETPA